MSNFLKQSTFLLVSSKPTMRSSLRKLLCDLGADNHSIEVASDFALATARLAKTPVNVIISDEDIGEKFSALDLIALHTANNHDSSSRLFILIAGDYSSFLKSDFIIKGGDLIISKPFTNATFTEAFLELIKAKNQMSPEQKTLSSLQDAVRLQDKNLALDYLGKFRDQSSQPALFCKGLIYELDNDYSAAYDTYTLALNKKVDVHSLVNFVHTGIQIKKYREMGSYVEKWINDYPLYNKSVPDIARVLVYNQKFDLFEKISVLCSQRDFTDDLVKIPLAAGLVLAATTYLENDKNKAIGYALKGIEYSGFKKNILFKGLEVLVSAGAKPEAEKIYKLLMSKAPYSEDQELNQGIQNILKK